jgi:prophage antirepressor-like protein
VEGFAKPTAKPQVATYSFNGMDLRVVEIDGEPWFVAKDVCVAVAYQVKADGKVNTSGATRPLSPDEKGTYPVRTLGGWQHVSIISESGLYKLVMRSDKKEAKAFQDWVTREVLPSIRKTECVNFKQQW